MQGSLDYKDLVNLRDLDEIIGICFQHHTLILSRCLSFCGITKFKNKVVVPVNNMTSDDRSITVWRIMIMADLFLVGILGVREY